MTLMFNHQLCAYMHKICHCNLHLHLLPLLPLLSPPSTPPSSFFTITSSHASSSYFTTLMTSMCNHQVCTCMHKMSHCNQGYTRLRNRDRQQTGSQVYTSVITMLLLLHAYAAHAAPACSLSSVACNGSLLS